LYFLDDHYYSSGIFLQYGKINESTEKASNTFNKKSYSLWELGQKIYNPSARFSKDILEYDYPYGGWLYVQYSKQKKLTENSNWQWGLQLGFTGEASLAHWLQNKYHKVFLNISEMSWTDQVPQSFHLNFLFNYFKKYKINSAMKVNTEVFSMFGTQKTGLGLRAGLVFGDSFVLPLGGNYLFDQNKGDGLYFGIKTDYLIHDYMISGSFLNQNAPFTLPSIPFRTTIESGFSYHSKEWKFLIMYNQSSRDNSIQPRKNHRFLNITITHFLSN